MIKSCKFKYFLFIVYIIFLSGCTQKNKSTEEKMVMLLNECIRGATHSYDGKNTVFIDREPTREELTLCTEYSKSVLTLQSPSSENIDDYKTTKN